MSNDEKLPPMHNSKKHAGHDAKKCGGTAHQRLTEIGQQALSPVVKTTGNHGRRAQ
jgi:hypothetical protein